MDLTYIASLPLNAIAMPYPCMHACTFKTGVLYIAANVELSSLNVYGILVLCKRYTTNAYSYTHSKCACTCTMHAD